jgi:hypothetical protein
MTFGQQVLASFIGTTFGFAFAILLFLITNAIRRFFERKTLRKHLKREFEYDISLLQEWIEEIEKILRKITANDPAVFSYLRYTFFQRTFMQEAFRTGMMYNSLNNEDISNLNTVLLHCDLGIEQYVNSFIKQWQTGQLGQQEALRKFEFEKDELGKYKKRLQKILQKLNK